MLDRPAYTTYRVHFTPYVDVLLHVLVSTQAKFEHPFLNLGTLLQIFGSFRADVDIWNSLFACHLDRGGALTSGRLRRPSRALLACFGACVESLASSSRLRGLLLQLQMRNVSSLLDPQRRQTFWSQPPIEASVGPVMGRAGLIGWWGIIVQRAADRLQIASA